MQPEIACMRVLEGNQSAPKIIAEGGFERPFSEGTLLCPLLYETARRVMKQGMNPRLVDSLVEPYVLTTKNKWVDSVKNMIANGQTPEEEGMLSW